MDEDVGLVVQLGREMISRPLAFRGVRAAAELLKVRDKAGDLVPLVANAAQREFERRRGEKNVVLKARQMGLSTWVAGRFLLKTLSVPGTLTVMVAHTRESAEQIFRIVQRMWENLPTPLQEGVWRRSKVNAGQMVFEEMDSEFRVLSAGDEGAGRGLSVQNLHCSEVSRWPGNAAATLAGLKAALVPGGEMVVESTPNGAYGCFYEEWIRAGEAGAVQHFFPWWREAGYVGAAVFDWSEEEIALVEREGLTAEQIGFRRGLQRTYGTLMRQEFAEDAMSCFLASGECFFEAGVVEKRLREVGEPVAMRRGGTLRSWMPFVRGREYLVAADPAGGGEVGDFAAVQVIDRATGMQCAELRERLGPRELSEVLMALAAEYGGALIVVERNNHGAGVLAYLERRGVAVYESGGQAGFLTTSISRPAMLARLRVLLSERGELFQSARLLEECRSFVRGPGGRGEAASGAHDDCVMAMAMGIFLVASC